MSSSRTCYDHRKIGQVIDQMRLLGNNLDELRAEIRALRLNNSVQKEEKILYNNDLKERKNKTINILKKVKKLIKSKKLISVDSWKEKGKHEEDQKAYYTYGNLDPTLSAFLNHLFCTGKKAGLWDTPSRVKYFKCQSMQTDSMEIKYRQGIADASTLSMHSQSIENAPRGRGSSFKRYEDKGNNKTIFPTRTSTIIPKCSDISCDLDFQVENQLLSPSTTEINIFPGSCVINNYSQKLHENEKESLTKSTQTHADRQRQKYRHKYPNFSFTKIKNAVITRKIVRNSNNSFTVCGQVNTKDRRYSESEYCTRCDCRKKRNYSVVSVDQELIDQDHFDDTQSVRRSSVTDSGMYETFSFEELLDPSVSSDSVNMEIHVCHNSDKIQEPQERRRPRTYVVRETNLKPKENNNVKQFENSIVCVDQSSDLTLSAKSFSNRNIPYNSNRHR